MLKNKYGTIRNALCYCYHSILLVRKASYCGADRKHCAVRNVASLVAAVVVYELTVPITRRSLRSLWESDAMTQ